MADTPTQPTLEDLGKLVKEKYPVYAKMSDAEIGGLVRQKYPDAYQRFMPVPKAGQPPKVDMKKSYVGEVYGKNRKALQEQAQNEKRGIRPKPYDIDQGPDYDVLNSGALMQGVAGRAFEQLPRLAKEAGAAAKEVEQATGEAAEAASKTLKQKLSALDNIDPTKADDLVNSMPGPVKFFAKRALRAIRAGKPTPRGELKPPTQASVGTGKQVAPEPTPAPPPGKSVGTGTGKTQPVATPPTTTTPTPGKSVGVSSGPSPRGKLEPPTSASASAPKPVLSSEPKVIGEQIWKNEKLTGGDFSKLPAAKQNEILTKYDPSHNPKTLTREMIQRIASFIDSARR